MTFQVKHYSRHWAIRVFNSAGEVVQVWTGNASNRGWLKECQQRAKKMCEHA
jgi:hypothetical protein